MEGFIALAVVLGLIFLYQDFIYPCVIYPWKARRFGAGSLPRRRSWPLGIPVTIRFLSELRKETALQYMWGMVQGETMTVLRQLCFKWTVATRDPENIKAVLATKFHDFSLGERNTRMRPVIGSGIFTQDGAEWKHSRNMLKPQFTKEQIGRLDVIGNHVDELIDQIRKHGNRVELQRFFHLMTMDTATEFLFGQSVNSLEFSNESKGVPVTDPSTGEKIYSADFVESYTYLNRLILQKIIFNDFDWLAVLLHPSYKKHKRRVNIFLDHYVQKALEVTEKSDAPTAGYIFSYELARETRDPIVLRDQLFNILIAGRDTTASTLSYTFHYLTNYPEVWQKIRDEVWSIFPNGDSSAATYEDLRKAKYVHMVIKEVLRLDPAVPLNFRTAIRDTSLPRGGGPHGDLPVFVPKGTLVNYPTYMLHRDKNIYGQDSEEFKPERWAPENKKPNSPMYSWGYIPFNAGPRICLGQQFAITEIAFTIIKLALAYETIKPDTGFETKLRDKYTLTSMVGGSGVPVILN